MNAPLRQTPGRGPRVMVAGLWDWHFREFRDAIAGADAEVVALNALPRWPRAPRSWGHGALALAWKARQRLAREAPPFFRNPAVYHGMQAFDRFAEGRLATARPDAVLAWTGMAKRTLREAQDRGAAAILIQCNSPLAIYEERLREAYGPGPHIPARWIRDQAEEYAQADLVVVESRFSAEGLHRMGMAPERIAVVPPHVAVPAAPAPRPDEVRFCLIQPNRRKGLHLLLDWWAAMGDAPELRLIGHVLPDELPPGPLPPGVGLSGHLTRAAYDEELARLAVLLMPTYEDGGPRAMFESMARGLCVIASEFSAAPDHITNGVNGFVLPLHDRDAWIDTIRWCRRNPDRVHEIGQEARRYVSRHLAPELLAGRWRGLLGTALAPERVA